MFKSLENFLGGLFGNFINKPPPPSWAGVTSSLTPNKVEKPAASTPAPPPPSPVAPTSAQEEAKAEAPPEDASPPPSGG